MVESAAVINLLYAVFTHSAEIRRMNVTNVTVLGTWRVTVLVIAATPEQHHLVAGNILRHKAVTRISW